MLLALNVAFFHGYISYYLSFSELLVQVWVLFLQVFCQVGSVSTLGHTCFVTPFAQWCISVNGFTVLICFQAEVIPCSTSCTWFIYELRRGDGCSSCHSLSAPVSLSLSLLLRNTACLAAVLSGRAKDRVQSTNNPWPCPAFLRGTEACFLNSLFNLSGIAV